MNWKKIFTILGIISAVIVSLYLLAKPDFENLLYKYFYNRSQQTPKEQGCKNGSDCIVVQDAWCKTVLSINKAYKEKWLEQNLKDAQKAKENRQTCKPTTEEYTNTNNFSAECREGICFAQYKDNSGIENCEDVRDLTKGTVFTVSKSHCESCGGKWGYGLHDNGCNPPTSDFGKVCEDHSDCEGLCLAVPEDSPKAVLGECSQYKFVFGCNREVVDGKVQPELCRD